VVPINAAITGIHRAAIDIVPRKGFLFLFPAVFASGQRLIEYPTTKFQRPSKLGALAFGRLEAILESFHRIAHVFYFTTMFYFLQGCAPFIPAAARAGLRQQDTALLQ